MAGSRAPGSLRDANWAGSGDLALREMPTKMHLFSQAWTLASQIGCWTMLCGTVTDPCRDPRLIARLGSLRVKFLPRDLALSYKTE